MTGPRKGFHRRARARLTDWEASFNVVYDRDELDDITSKLRIILEDAGERMGLLDYRPARMGPYGTFEVTEYNVEEDERYVKIKVQIRGLTPLLMNQLTLERLKRTTKPKPKEYDMEKEARESAYIAEIDGREQLYIPSRAIYAMIIETAKRYPGETRIRGKGYLSHLLADAIRIEPEKIPLGHCNYEIDIRPVAIKIREKIHKIKRARAVVPEWEASFNIVYNKDLTGEMTPQDLEETLKICGGRGTPNLLKRPKEVTEPSPFPSSRSLFRGVFPSQRFKIEP